MILLRRWGLDRNTVQTLVTSMVLQFVVLVSGVIAARMLGPLDRGNLALFWTITLVVSQVLILGLPQAVTFEMAKYGWSASTILRVLRFRVMVMTLVALAVQAILIIIIFGGDDRVESSAALSLTAIPTIIAYVFAVSALQGQERFTQMNIARLVPFAAYSLVLVIGVLMGEDSLFFVTSAWAGTYLVAAIWSIWMVFHGMPGEKSSAEEATAGVDLPPGEKPLAGEIQLAGETQPVEAEIPIGTEMPVGAEVSAVEERPAGGPDANTMTRFGITGFLGASPPTETFRPDQLVVGLVLAPITLGLYVAALSLTNLPRFLSLSVGLVAYPRIAALEDLTRIRPETWKYTGLGALVAIVAALPMFFFAHQILSLFFGSDFAPATLTVRILLLGAPFIAARRVMGDCLRGADHPEAGTIAELAGWFWLIPALFIGASLDGIEGVAAALSSSFVISLIVIVVLLERFDLRISHAKS